MIAPALLGRIAPALPVGDTKVMGMLAYLDTLERTIARDEHGCDLGLEIGHVFFRSKKRGSVRGDMPSADPASVRPVSDWSDELTPRDPTGERPTGERPREAEPDQSHLREWRSSAQRVSRAWDAWLAAEGHERSLRYGALVSALADEERAAAEVERIVNHSPGGTTVP